MIVNAYRSSASPRRMDGPRRVPLTPLCRGAGRVICFSPFLSVSEEQVKEGTKKRGSDYLEQVDIGNFKNVEGGHLRFSLLMRGPHKRTSPTIGFPISLRICGSCHKRQKQQAPTPQAPIRNRQTEKSQTPKVLTGKLTLPNLT